MFPTVRPAAVMALDAAVWVCPVTFGTLTGAGPEETTSKTVLPELTLVPPAGVWLITIPAGTVALEAVDMDPTSPAPLMAAVAAVWVWPTTFGTVTGAGGPEETTRFTALP